MSRVSHPNGIKVALVQNAPRLNRANFATTLELFRDASNSADVVVFPELSLNGYLLQDKVFEDAWKLEELEDLAAASQSVDLVVGAAIKIDGRTYNSGIYFSGGEIAHIHHKVHLPNYGMFEEARYFFKGESIETFETKFGKTAMLVCEDLWRAETVAELAVAKPNVIYVIANSPARGFEEDGLQIEGQWDALLKSAALLCSAYVVFVNRVGFEDGLGFWGGSRVITPKGEIEHRLPNFEDAVETVKLSHSLYAVQEWLAKID
jgi:predicted amidohydrolase